MFKLHYFPSVRHAIRNISIGHWDFVMACRRLHYLVVFFIITMFYRNSCIHTYSIDPDQTCSASPDLSTLSANFPFVGR